VLARRQPARDPTRGRQQGHSHASAEIPSLRVKQIPFMRYANPGRVLDASLAAQHCEAQCKPATIKWISESSNRF